MTKTLKQALIEDGGFDEFTESNDIIEIVKEWLTQKRPKGGELGILNKQLMIDELLEEINQP